ncbi:hypothetical protein L7F22_049877 [Adiantum nelumboides]|nr:hypothetical protein [Adiantum nelumboides]
MSQKIRTMSKEGCPGRWETFNLKEDMGTAMGMRHLQALLQKLQEAQDNPSLAPLVHNLLATRDLELRYNTRLPSRLGESLPKEEQERGTNSVPLREKTVPLSPRSQREGAMEQPCQEPLATTSNERGKNKERSILPKQGRKQRRSQEPSLRRRRASSHDSTSSSQSGRNPHGRFYKERRNAPSPPHDSSSLNDTSSSSSSNESSSSSSMEERRKKKRKHDRHKSKRVEQETQETLPKQILKEKKPVPEPPLKITPIRVVEPTTLIPRPTHMGESSTSAALFNEDIWMMQMQDQGIQMKKAYTRIRMSQSEVQEELRAMQIDRDTLLRKNQEQESLLEELQTTHIQVLLEMEDWKSRHEQTKAELSLKQQLQKDYDNLCRAHSIAITNMKAAESQVQELLEFSHASLTTSAVPPQQLDNQLNEELQRLRQEVETLKKQLAEKMVVNPEQTKASKVPDSMQASSQPPAHIEPLPSMPSKLPPVEGQEEQHQTKHDEGPPLEQSDNSTLLERLIREEEVEQIDAIFGIILSTFKKAILTF